MTMTPKELEIRCALAQLEIVGHRTLSERLRAILRRRQLTPEQSKAVSDELKWRRWKMDALHTRLTRWRAMLKERVKSC